MASLISFAKRKLNAGYHGVNPFDGGQGWTNNRPPPRPAPRPVPLMTNNTPVRFGNQQVQRPPVPLRTAGPDPVANYLNKTVVQPLAAPIRAIGTSPLTSGIKVAVASATGNKKAQSNAISTLKTGLKDSLTVPTQDIKLRGGRVVKAPTPEYVTGVVSGSAGGAKSIKAPEAVKVAKGATKIVPKVSVSPAKITAPDVALKSTTGVLHKIDPRLADMVTKRREIGETAAAQAKAGLKITNTLKDNEQVNMARVLKGTEKPLNATVAAAAKETRKALNVAYYRAKNTGVPVKARRQNYYPQILNPKTFAEGSKQSDAAIQHLIHTKQAGSEAEAIGLLRKFKDTRRVGPYGNLTKPRTLDLPGYAESNSAIHQYLDKAYATIAHHKVMGKDDRVLNKVLADVKKNGGDYEQAIKTYKQASGIDRGSQRLETASRAATNFQGATKLGLSALGNLTQQANTMIVGGVGKTIKNAATQLRTPNREFIKKTGVADEQVAHEALFGEQGVNKFRNITAPGFEQVEKGNRSTSGLVGRDRANQLNKKAVAGNSKAAETLRKEFGITKLSKKGLSEADQIKAARVMTERTQFRTGPQDLPGWASTPTGRVVSQFKRYPYKQAQFLKKEIYDQAKQGNVMPLVRAVGVGAPIGIGEQKISDKLRGSNFSDQSLPEKVLNVAGDATGANLILSLAQGLYPSSHDGPSYVSKVAKTLGGPTISDAVKGLQAGFEASKGKYTNAERLALSHIPVVGATASNRLLPYQTGPTGTAGVAKTGDPKKDKANSDAEYAAIKKNPPKGQGLTQLADGRYVYSIDDGATIKATKDLREAGNAIREDTLRKSGNAYMETPNVANGGVVTRLSADGKVNSTTKTKFDYSLGTQMLEQQKRNGDIDGWLNTAQKQLDSIDKQLQDPRIDPLDRITLQNDADALVEKANKYIGYGGFTKPKSGGSGGGSRGGSRGGGSKGSTAFITSGFKTASRAKVSKPSGVKVKVSSAKPAKTRKLAVSKMPRIG